MVSATGRAGIAPGDASRAPIMRRMSAASAKGRAASWISTRLGFSAAQALQPEAHRFLAGGTALHRRQEIEALGSGAVEVEIVAMDHDPDSADGGMPGEGFQAMTQHRPARPGADIAWAWHRPDDVPGPQRRSARRSRRNARRRGWRERTWREGSAPARGLPSGLFLCSASPMLLQIPAILSLLPACLLLLRPQPKRDLMFWVAMALAVAGPTVVVLQQNLGGWLPSLSGALWASVAAAMILFAVVAALNETAWRLLPLLAIYGSGDGHRRRSLRRGPDRASAAHELRCLARSPYRGLGRHLWARDHCRRRRHRGPATGTRLEAEAQQPAAAGPAGRRRWRAAVHRPCLPRPRSCWGSASSAAWRPNI